MPVIPRAEFTGKTGCGDWADSLLELDSDFGALLDLLNELDVAEDTIVVFAGDNGPEEVVLWRGSPGFWEGSYFAGAKATCAHALHRPLAEVRAGGADQQRHHARDRLVHDSPERSGHERAEGSSH